MHKEKTNCLLFLQLFHEPPKVKEEKGVYNMPVALIIHSKFHTSYHLHQDIGMFTFYRQFSHFKKPRLIYQGILSEHSIAQQRHQNEFHQWMLLQTLSTGLSSKCSHQSPGCDLNGTVLPVPLGPGVLSTIFKPLPSPIKFFFFLRIRNIHLRQSF